MGHKRDWQKTDPDLHSHPGFLKLCRELGAQPYQVDGWLSGIWRHAYRQAEDGDLTRFGEDGIAAMAGYDGSGEIFVAGLVGAHFLDREDGTIAIHGWTDWGGALFAEREADAERKRVQRSQEVPGTTRDTRRTQVDPRAKTENKREKEHLSALRAFEPDFAPWWQTYGKVGGRADALAGYLHWRQQGASREDLLLAAKNYRGWCLATDTLQKHGGTFLAKKPNRWEEYVKPEPAEKALPHDPTSDDRHILCHVCGEEVTPAQQLEPGATVDKKGWRHAPKDCGADFTQVVGLAAKEHERQVQTDIVLGKEAKP